MDNRLYIHFELTDADEWIDRVCLATYGRTFPIRRGKLYKEVGPLTDEQAKLRTEKKRPVAER